MGKEQKDEVKVTEQTTDCVSHSGGNFSLSSHTGQTESPGDAVRSLSFPLLVSLL